MLPCAAVVTVPAVVADVAVGTVPVTLTVTAPQFKQWNNLIPGSPDAVDKGCLCPILDNQEMPADKKWVDAECPIHGRKINESN